MVYLMENEYFKNLLHKNATSNLADDSVFEQKKKSAKLKYLADLASLRADRLDDKLKEQEKQEKEQEKINKDNIANQTAISKAGDVLSKTQNTSIGGNPGQINPAFPPM